MSTEPEDPTLDQRVEQLEQDVELLKGELDNARTTNAVLQERYGVLVGQYDALVGRVGELGSPA